MTEKLDQLHPVDSKTELGKVAEEQKIREATRLQLHELLGETKTGSAPSSTPNAQHGTGAQKGGVESGSSMGHTRDESVSEVKKEGEGKTEPNKPQLPENPQNPQLSSSSVGATMGTGPQTGGEISGTSTGAAGQSGGNTPGGVTSGSNLGF